MIFNLKRRPQMRQVTVQFIEQVTPRVRRIVFGGETLAGFSAPRPGAHIKLLFNAAPKAPADPKKMRSQMRTYTPRHFNPDSQELTVEFVLHGDGLASTWAAQAQVGDTLTIAGPGGGMDIPDRLTTMVMLVDESAIPAAGAVLEALPANCTPIIICEVEDAREQRSLSSSIEVAPTWLFRQEQAASPGLLLESYLPNVLTSVKDFDDVFWWIACEANMMRRLRSQLLKQPGVSKDRLVSRGYWKSETSNYPDHDYGES
ncbi:MAG: siderophore-interacting protein [Leptolyngbyaceae cyanobacterium]